MQILICPGIHSVELTHQFLIGLGELPNPVLIFPTDRYPAYSGWHIVQFLKAQCSSSEMMAGITAQRSLYRSVLLLGFSAGVVGAASAAMLWQSLGGSVKALIAIDGWGVPLGGCFPIYRVSHDPFTHWSSALLGAGDESFYAEPSVAHLELWRSPQRVWGWHIKSKKSNTLFADSYTATTAAHFIQQILYRYGCPG